MKKVFLIMFLSSLTLAQAWQHFSVADGLTSNRISCMAYDASTHTVWAGTDEFVGYGYGLNKYQDGVWTQYTRDDHPMLNGAIHNIAVDSIGGIWLATTFGLITRYNPSGGILNLDAQGRWNVFNNTNGLNSNATYSVFVTPGNQVWIFGGWETNAIYDQNTGTFKYDTLGLFTAIPSALNPDGIRILSSGEIAFTMSRIRLVLMNTESWDTIPIPRLSAFWDVTSMACDSENVLYLKEERCFHRFDGCSLTTFSDPRLYSSGRGIATDANDNVWMAGIRRLIKVSADTDSIQEYPYPDSLRVSNGRSIFVDRYGFIWINDHADDGVGILIFNEDEYLSGIEDDIKPAEIEIGVEAYPNPFNSSCKISYSTADSHLPINLIISDIHGRKVLNKSLKASQSSYLWDASAMASGVYLIVLQQGDNTVTKRVMLLK